MVEQDSYILFAITPLILGLTSYLIARQMRVLENIPFVSVVFDKRRFLLSVLIGLLTSLALIAFNTIGSQLTIWHFSIFPGLLFLSTLGVYVGISLGHRNINSIDITTSESVPLDENFTIEDSINSIKITIHAKKRWVLFSWNAFRFVLVALFGLPILTILFIRLLQNHLPDALSYIAGLMAGGFFVYMSILKIPEVLNDIFDLEVIEFDPSEVKIEKRGSGFSYKKVYPAENIVSVSTLIPTSETVFSPKSLLFVFSGHNMFEIRHQHGLIKLTMFGRDITISDALKILEAVYRKYPQYKGN
jgi:hypothetical protein